MVGTGLGTDLRAKVDGFLPGLAVIVDSTTRIRSEWFFTIIIRRYVFFKDKYRLFYVPGTDCTILNSHGGVH
jgi:hypothetical protein